MARHGILALLFLTGLLNLTGCHSHKQNSKREQLADDPASSVMPMGPARGMAMPVEAVPPGRPIVSGESVTTLPTGKGPILPPITYVGGTKPITNTAEPPMELLPETAPDADRPPALDPIPAVEGELAALEKQPKAILETPTPVKVETASPKPAPPKLAPEVDATGGLVLTPQGSAPARARYGHAPDYTWLQGTLERHPSGYWVLLYTETSSRDRWGGRVELLFEKEILALKEGTAVRIEGGPPVERENGKRLFPGYPVKTIKLTVEKR